MKFQNLFFISFSFYVNLGLINFTLKITTEKPHQTKKKYEHY